MSKHTPKVAETKQACSFCDEIGTIHRYWEEGLIIFKGIKPEDCICDKCVLAAKEVFDSEG